MPAAIPRGKQPRPAEEDDSGAGPQDLVYLTLAAAAPWPNEGATGREWEGAVLLNIMSTGVIWSNRACSSRWDAAKEANIRCCTALAWAKTKVSIDPTSPRLLATVMLACFWAVAECPLFPCCRLQRCCSDGIGSAPTSASARHPAATFNKTAWTSFTTHRILVVVLVDFSLHVPLRPPGNDLDDKVLRFGVFHTG